MLRAVTASASPGVDLAMELRNADGSVAEMSGNGIRCFVQAAVGAGLVRPGRVAVATLAGVRMVDYREGDEPGLAHAGVDMGPARLGPEVSVDELVGTRAALLVDMGNPHVVLLGEPVDAAVVAGVGPRLSARYREGANVEFVWPGPDAGELTMRVWERGVGETLACGTGACATAAAAEAWGVTGRHVRVHSPGGVLDVTLGDAGIVLAGPTRHVADVTIRESTLAALVAALAAAGAADGRLVTDDEVPARP
jgi:diaminopimelate epimerase